MSFTCLTSHLTKLKCRQARVRDNLYLECATSLSEPEITTGTESVSSSRIVEDRIQAAVTEAENSKREARFEASKREEAEKSAIDALKMV